MRVARFTISALTAFAVDLSLLYFLHDVLGMWNVYAIIIATLVAFTISLSLQKFWTFRNSPHHHIKGHLKLYVAVTITNFFLNIALVYAGIHFFHLHPIESQIIVAVLICISSIRIYSRHIFKMPFLELLKSSTQ